uniref:Alpha-1,4 glucan phosphorylase n=1 Tax=Mastigamoeba balamuthi TaxID=108607 RepID=Q8WQT6_MASBA|nr:glycogen phosphorylase [Mastigamoeba balamuthi]
MHIRRTSSVARLRLSSSGDGPLSPMLQAARRPKLEKLWDLVDEYLHNDTESIMRSMADHFEYTLARNKWNLAPQSLFQAAAYSLRDRMIEWWNDTQEYFYDQDSKRAYYMSIEFLMGRTLTNALISTGLLSPYYEALKEFGENLETIADLEHDAGLGSGGLGRLAACFLDSLATLNYPAWGYGIRYKYGQFKQNIVRGYQVETPDFWLESGNPWEIPRQDIVYKVGMYGSVQYVTRSDGSLAVKWEPGHCVGAVAYDTPIPGFNTKNTLSLRLWSSKPLVDMNPEELKADPWDMLRQNQADEEITSVLYPKADSDSGKELRLKQQYFFSCATLQDIIRRFKKSNRPFAEFPDKVAIQLNDTHPTVSVPELMRILVDEESLPWDQAWAITTKTFGFTNHTVLPEALEKWSVPMFAHLLPRHMQIVFEINHRFLEEVKVKFDCSPEVISRLSIIEESNPQQIRMANLAIVGSHTVNGVARIHSEILQQSVFADWHRLWPGKIINITNGVTPRRWLYCCNPTLSSAVTKQLGGNAWVTDLSLLKDLRSHITQEFLRDVREANKVAKERLRKYVSKLTNGAVDLDTSSLFDTQVKRIHEYKRQLMNILGVIHRYQCLKALTPTERSQQVKRTHIFAGKAAASYQQAKAVIKLINTVADVVNSDPQTKDFLTVVFLPNYSVSLAELIVPATDLSEHISTAGTEASGTSNMKFAMNAGLIIGTLDGANVEIVEACGQENHFIFGATAPEVDKLRAERQSVAIDQRLYNVLISIERGDFGASSNYRWLIDPLWQGNDYYCVAHDFPLYLEAQQCVDADWRTPDVWAHKTVLTMFGMGTFSSDHSIHQYARNIWNIKPARMPTEHITTV